MDGNESEGELNIREMVSKQNKKNKKSGGFQAMGLSNFVFNGIMKKGYKVPTPIQRKCIPVIMSGKDVVAMARTGSGKTATFLIPMFEKLQSRSASAGARALIMSPTRELALQTLKFTRELGKFGNLRSAGILGGDKLDDQFEAIHESPDIIVATPGRFLHLVMEMDLKLNMIEYVVFDEADRLFEMGFQEQLREVINRLPDSRQTLLFSATLPKSLVEFAKAGLSDPILIRLDVDTKLNQNLKLGYIKCHSEDKFAVLLHLLRTVINRNELTTIFLATKHHIDYLTEILEKAGISSTFVYSSLDQYARKDNVAKFQRKKVSVLLVTDIAARGIDIPVLDNVINFHFPAKSKLFVHRVGRVARAGRFGTAYSLVSQDEVPYLLDLQLFLGSPLKLSNGVLDKRDWNGEFGSVPQWIIDENKESIIMWHTLSLDLTKMKQVCDNGYDLYLKSRPPPSSESVKRMKAQPELFNLKIHPLFEDVESNNERNELLQRMKTYKPQSTIFEIGATSKSLCTKVMKTVRDCHSKSISKHHQNVTDHQPVLKAMVDEEELDTNELESAFATIVSSSKKRKDVDFDKPKKKKRSEFKDKEFYLSNQSSDHHFEQGLEVDKSTFSQQANSAVLDLTGDDSAKMRNQAFQKKWDRKKKKFVQVGGSEKAVKKIKTESGVWIPASYKKNLYKEWQKKSKFGNRSDDDSDGEAEKNDRKPMKHRGRRNQNNKSQGNRPMRRELKTKEEILKKRTERGRKEFLQNRKSRGKKSNNKRKSGKF